MYLRPKYKTYNYKYSRGKVRRKFFETLFMQSSAMTSKAQSLKNGIFDFIKHKAASSSKDISKEIKETILDWEKMFNFFIK